MPASKEDESKTVHLVIQRYRWCKILLEESEWQTVGLMPEASANDAYSDNNVNDSDEAKEPTHCGWLVYMSFAHGASMEMVQKAVLTLFQLPFGTWGKWERGSRPQSLSAMMVTVHEEEVAETASTSMTQATRLSVVLCPQANLVSQVKRKGKSVQYRGQCDKTISEQLFLYFALFLQALLLEHQCQLRGESIPDDLQSWKEVQTLDNALSTDSSTSWLSALDLVSVVVGSFGKRQGIELHSDMGPFCHVVQV